MSGAIYLPFEIVECARTLGWIAGILLAVNALVVVLVWSQLDCRFKEDVAPRGGV